uniref:HECT-type E3 ubiquitin transferase n=1 Tax=Globisporangium ultimum (strain ATCC 200006 / CBS 805.95 / DAOM BR144) TaxID=431595 RepID=K3WJQ6_GLOUD
MGGGLRKPSSSSFYTVKCAFATTSGPSHSATVVPTAHDAALALDAQLDREEELQAQKEEERAQKQKVAVAHVVENLFPYAPVVVQTQKYPSGSPKAGQAYLWIAVDEDAIKHRGGTTNSPVRYPVGVAVDADGNVFVSEVASGKARHGAGDPSGIHLTQTISAESIMEFAFSKQVPPVPMPPRLVEATQISLALTWKKSTDTTVDRYEIQYRRADSPNNPWSSLAVVSSGKNVSLENVPCHTAYLFRMRGRNPAGWSDFSSPSDVFWSLPGVPSLPNPPVAGALTNTYASIFWSRVNDHGALPVVYFLEMRESAGGGGGTTTFQQIYEGTECSFVAGGLRANTAYLFRLQASNVVGSTAFVESKPIRTLAHGRPGIVELTSFEQTAAYDRWVQCWDPKTEQVFFFNKYTCQRVTEEPREVAEAREKAGLSNVEETPEMIFRRKRFRFHRDLRQSMHGINFSTTISLELARENMLEDTFAHFQRLSKQELVAKPKITFANEPGIDSGGLTKDWFLQVSKLALHKQRALFKLCDHNQFEIDSNSSRNASHLQYFRFLGKFIAKAIFDRQTLDLPFCDVIHKHLLHIPIVMDDLRQMDAQFHKSLTWMLKNSIADVIDETFSVEVEDGSSKKPVVVDLKENGRDIPVTDLNKKEYVELVLQWRTEFGVKAQLDALNQGFHSLIPTSFVKMFDLSELRMLMNGKPMIDVEELRASTVFQGGYSEHSQVVLWLWQALREFSLEIRGQFLKFMTGTNKIPLDGFEPPLNLTKSDLDPVALPRTHTCFNQLVLPEYASYEVLVEKITFAIQNAEGFELS